MNSAASIRARFFRVHSTGSPCRTVRFAGFDDAAVMSIASTRVAKSARAEMALPVHASTPAVLAVRVTFVPSMRSDISPLVSAFSTCGQCKSIPRGMLSKHNSDTPDRKKLNSA